MPSNHCSVAIITASLEEIKSLHLGLKENVIPILIDFLFLGTPSGLMQRKCKIRRSVFTVINTRWKIYRTNTYCW